LDELAVSSDDAVAEMLDGDQMLRWIKKEHERLRAFLEHSSTHATTVDDAMLDEISVILAGLAQVLEALGATWGRQQEEVLGELYELQLLQQYAEVLSWCSFHR
jgi:hypothetical protein